MISLAITLVLAAFIGWFAWHTYKSYRDSSEPSVWKRLYSAGMDSATIFWAAVMSWVTAAFNFTLNISDFFGATEFREFITQHFSAQWASAIFLGSMFIIVLARLRTLKLTP